MEPEEFPEQKKYFVVLASSAKRCDKTAYF
jgi:hypothetical protein